ncbi:MAG: hypothetical protein JNL67_06840 [Planctomycetaceae bacterium]|nr:hypothetical protein [Planctomycetaceae bacterium]
MIRKLQEWTLSTLALGLALGASLPALAQSGSANDPAVIVSIKNINAQLDDIKYLGEKAGFGDQVAMVPMMARGFLGGVDLKKPAGVAVWFEGQEPVAVGMVPVTDIDTLLDSLSNYGVNVDEEGDLYYLETPGQELVIKVSGGYAFLSDSEESLESVPTEPASILGGVSKDYILGAKLFVQKIPAELREMAIEQMQQGFEQAMEEMDDEALADLQAEANEMQVKQLVELIENSDVLEVGLGVQKSTDKLVFDMAFTGLPGSKMAKSSEAMQGKSSKFTKFLVDSAAMNMNGFGVMLEDDQKATKALLANLKETAMKGLEEDNDMSSDELAMVQGLLSDVFDVLDSTIDGGFVDFGGTMMMDEEGVNFVAGTSLANATKFDEMIAKISGMAKTQNEVAIEVSDASVGGVGMKKMVVTLPEGVDQEAIDMFGEKITLLMGRDGSAAYVAVGTNPSETFETVMKNSGTAGEASAQYNFRVLPILKFASRNPEAAEVLGALLEGFKSTNDRITLHQKMIPNGMSMQGAADADLIKLFADLGQQMQGRIGPGADF